MRVTCYPTIGKAKSVRICEAFARGCGGAVATVHERKLRPGAAFFYGWTEYTWPLMLQCVEERRDWYYCDNAYYYGRPRFFRVTHNALMHDGSGPGGKLALGVDMKPWQEDGGHIVVTTQSDGFYSLRLRQTREEWVTAVKRRLRQFTERPIKVCHKPGSWTGEPHPHRNFEEVLPGAWAVVSHSSSTMVRAVVEGIPVFSLAPSMASVMGLDDLSRIETPARPEGRKRWIENLMANQWEHPDMINGTCWRQINSQEPVSMDLARFREPAN